MTSSAPFDSPLANESSTQGGTTLIAQIRFLAAMAMSAVVFWHFGYWAAHVVDPRGPITLLLVDQGVITMAELLGLAVVVSGLAVAICGAGTADRGPLAVAVGLASLNLRGSELDSLILYRLGDAGLRRGPADLFPTWGLIAETWLWLAMIGVGYVVGRWVESWNQEEIPPADLRPHPSPAQDLRLVFGTVLIVSLGAWSILTYSLGREDYPLLKGQIYFALVFSFLVGTVLAHWFFRVHSYVWLLVTIAVVATVGYAVAGPDLDQLSAAQKNGLYVVLHPLARPLPVEYAAMGAIGILLKRDALSAINATFGLTEEV